MPNDKVRLCVGDHCVDLATVSRSGDGSINPPSHLFDTRANLDLGSILSAANPTMEARLTGLLFLARELGQLAESLRASSPDQAEALLEGRAGLVKKIMGLMAKLA
ncbi:MAG TPA: hypothetical protein PKD77_01645 [Rudaea sp.]|nr:hypothetical protein [Rudaea sp.]